MFGRFVVGALRARWMVLVSGALAVALAPLAGGSAKAWPTSTHRKLPVEFLESGTVKVNHGFKLSLEASNELVEGTRHHANRLVRAPEAVRSNASAASGQTARFDAAVGKVSGKGVGSEDQFADYLFESGVTFKGSTDLKSAKLMGTLRDHRGQVDLTFHATGPAKSVPVPKNCTGTPGKRRRGRLEGKFVLKADKLGTEKLSGVNAVLVRPAKITCPVGKQRHGVELFGYEPTSSNRPMDVDAFKTPGRRPVEEDVEEQHDGGGFSFEYLVFVKAPRSDYTHSSDLSTAHLDGYGAIKGSATFAGGPPTDGQSDGELSGDLSATSGVIGKIEPFSEGSLNASQTKS